MKDALNNNKNFQFKQCYNPKAWKELRPTLTAIKLSLLWSFAPLLINLKTISYSKSAKSLSIFLYPLPSLASSIALSISGSSKKTTSAKTKSFSTKVCGECFPLSLEELLISLRTGNSHTSRPLMRVTSKSTTLPSKETDISGCGGKTVKETTL